MHRSRSLFDLGRGWEGRGGAGRGGGVGGVDGGWVKGLGLGSRV